MKVKKFISIILALTMIVGLSLFSASVTSAAEVEMNVGTGEVVHSFVVGAKDGNYKDICEFTTPPIRNFHDKGYKDSLNEGATLRGENKYYYLYSERIHRYFDVTIDECTQDSVGAFYMQREDIGYRTNVYGYGVNLGTASLKLNNNPNAQKSDGFTDIYSMTVKSAPKSLTLTRNGTVLQGKTITIGVGETYSIRYDIDANSACNNYTVTHGNKISSTFTSRNTTNGTIQIVGAAEGTNTFTLSTYNQKKVSFTVVVKSAPQKVSLNKSSLLLEVGDKFDLDSYLPSNTASYVVDYTSNNAKVCSVTKAGGVVTAKGLGTATVTATTYNGKKATCKVEVISKPQYARFRTPYNVHSGIALEWYKATGAVKYRIERVDSGKPWTSNNISVVGTTQNAVIVDKNVVSNKCYDYRIISIGRKSETINASGRVGKTFLSAPDFKCKKNENSKSVTYSWGKVDGAVKYNLQVWNSRKNSWDNFATTGNSLTLYFSKNGTYYFRMQAVKNKNVVSGWSIQHKITL